MFWKRNFGFLRDVGRLKELILKIVFTVIYILVNIYLARRDINESGFKATGFST